MLEKTPLKAQTVELLPARTTMHHWHRPITVNLFVAENLVVVYGGHNYFMFNN